MKLDCSGLSAARGRPSLLALLILALLTTSCAQVPEVVRDEPRGEKQALAYYQMLGRFSAADLARERSILAAQAASPTVQIRQAMVVGHPRGQQDSARALALLEQLLKSNDPAAIELHALARLLADYYSERLRLEGQLERQGVQLKENQRKAQDLQEKLDGLADIERTLTPRPGSGRGGAR